MPNRLTDLLLILALMLFMWGANDPKGLADYWKQTTHGLEVIGRAFQFG